VLYRRHGKNQGIWAVPFSSATGESTGAPFIVTAAGSSASASRDGTLIYRPVGGASDYELARVGRDGAVMATLGQPQTDLWHPQLSPDASRVLVSAEENEEWDLWIHDVIRGTKTRLTRSDGREGLARWSPDGTEVYFHAPQGNSLSRIYSVAADGSGEPRDLTGGHSVSLSADGRWMAFVRDDDETGDDLWSLALDDESEPEVFLATDAGERQPSLSPDGKWLAYASDESGRREVYIKPFPSGPGKWQVSVDGGQRPSWSPDGKRVYFSFWEPKRNELSEVDVEVGSGLRLSAPRLVLDFRADPVPDNHIQIWRGYEMDPDGQSVLATRQVDDGEEQDENAMPSGIFVVQNWLAEFKE
jgi:dipeptidyl aminopeptidase/acylaminoacyl peptidase